MATMTDDELLDALAAALAEAEARCTRYRNAIDALKAMRLPALVPDEAAQRAETRPSHKRRGGPKGGTCDICGKTVGALVVHRRSCVIKHDADRAEPESGLGPIGKLPVNEEAARDAAVEPVFIPPEGRMAFGPIKQDPRPVDDHADALTVDDARAVLDGAPS